MKTIGRNDKVDFPALKLFNIKVKVDTGAYTSTIHSHDIKEVEVEGEKYLEFKLLDPEHKKFKDLIFRVKDYSIKKIKSSFGDMEERFIISTTIRIFAEELPIELSLSKRSDMKYPILLGRKFINKRFVVDTSQRNLSYLLKREQIKNQ